MAHFNSLRRPLIRQVRFLFHSELKKFCHLSVFFRRTFAKSTAEKPAGLVGYHHGVVDVVNTAYATPTSLPSEQPGNEEENHIYATIPDDQYLVPDAFNNGQAEEGKLKDDSSAMAAERKLNDYDV